jgi:transcriptional regulator with XRE-family HTH domain
MAEQSSTLAVPTWTLGDRLRKAREFAGLEQGELAEAIGISRGTVSNYELGRGQRPPKVIVLRAWAHQCGVPFEWIVEDFPFAEGASTNQVSSASNRGCMSTTRCDDAEYVLSGNYAAA